MESNTKACVAIHTNADKETRTHVYTCLWMLVFYPRVHWCLLGWGRMLRGEGCVCQYLFCVMLCCLKHDPCEEIMSCTVVIDVVFLVLAQWSPVRRHQRGPGQAPVCTKLRVARVLIHLARLPVMSCIVYKMLPCLTSSTIITHPRTIRSSDTGVLTIPRTSLRTHGGHSVRWPPTLWSSLPLDIRCAPSLDTFQKRIMWNKGRATKY